MRDELDRSAMATLSGGHLAVDFASGAVPAPQQYGVPNPTPARQ